MSVHSFIHVVILLGGIQGVVLGLVHGLRPTAFRWSRFVGWALFSHALSDVFLWLYWTGTPADLRVVRLLPLNVVLMPVYFLYTYIQGFTKAGQSYRKFSLILLIAASVELVVYLLPAGAALYEGVIEQPVLLFSKLIRTVLNISSLPFVVFACLSLNRIIGQYQLSVGESPAHRYQVAWLYQLLIGLSFVYTLAQLPLAVGLLIGFSSRILYYPLGIGSSLFLAWTGIRTFIIHERIRTDEPIAGDTRVHQSAQQSLYDQAIQLIEEEQLYKKSMLKLADVAERLSVSPNYLSRIVNQQAKKNFTDLINEFRVEEVKRLMTNPAFRNLTLEGLGREAGFGAKSTYQASFKRLTGLTPSEYRAQNRPAS